MSAGTANRIAWYSANNVISSGTITTDGAYLGSVSYLSINTSHQTSYRLYVNGITRSDNFISSIATGTQPYACSSTTLNTNLNADLLDGIHSSGFLGWTCMTAIGTSAPFQDSVNYFKNLSNLNNGGRMVYNYPGNEYTILYTRRNDSTAHGSILKWGYPDKYIRIIRMISGNPQSSDWEKIAAGNADVWTTARTLTIGNTGKSVDGSSNVSWSFDEIGVYNKTTSDDRYVNVSGDWMNTDAQIFFRGLNSSTSAYGSIGFRDSFNGKMHLGSDTYNTKALYVCSNGYNAANDCGGIAIDNDGVTAFGAGDTGSVFRVINEDNVADGAQFAVTKGSGGAFKYSLSVGQNTVNTSYKLHVEGTTHITNRLYEDEWIQFPAYTGLYWPNANNAAHFHPNNNTTYGTFTIRGTRNSYSGIQFGTSTSFMTIMDTSEHKGLYQEDQGLWIFYYQRSTKKVGIRTSSDWGADVNISGSAYITGQIIMNGHGYLMSGRSTSYNYGYSLSLGDSSQSMGMFSGPGGEEGAVIVSPDTCIIYNSFDQGYGFAIFDKDRGVDLTTANSRVFSIDQANYFAWSRGGFVKEGSDNNYALTGGGSHFAIHTGRNNEANKLVRTDGNGYIQAGWINTTSGDMGTTAIDRVYCSNDGYIRYKTKANFGAEMRDSGYMDGRWVLKTGDTMTGDLHVYAHTYHGYGTGSSIIDYNVYAMYVGTNGTRAGNAGWYVGGIAFSHMIKYSGGYGYCNSPQAWIGLRMVDYPGSERSSLVFATKPGTGTSNTGNDIPIERMCITPAGDVGIGTTGPSYKLHVNGATYSSGFRHTSVNSDSYVLLGGGGYKAESSLSVSFATSCTNATNAANLLPENSPHYFRTAGSGWEGGMFWGSASTESMSFIANQAGTRFQFVCGSNIASWTSSTWQSVTPHFCVRNTGIYVQGFFYVESSGAYHTSDIRKKYDIRDLLNEDIIKLFNTNNAYIRYYKWKENDKPSYGFIAQELLEYCPEAVNMTDEDQYYSVNYNIALSKIVGVLFKKVKEQDRIIKELQKRMEEL